MKKADPEKRRLAGVLLSKSFTICHTPMTETQRVALECLKQIASEGRVALREEITAAIGSQNMCGSTATGAVNGLVEKGYVEHVAGKPLQRGLWVRIVGTELVTKQPKCVTPHWRTITDRAPVPAIHIVRGRDVSLAQWIEKTVRELGCDYMDFAMELMKRGAQDYLADEEMGEAA